MKKDKEEIKKDLEKVLSLFSGILSNNKKITYEVIKDSELVKLGVEQVLKGSPEGFDHNILNKFEDITEAILESQLKNKNLIFIFKNSRFVENHFESLFFRFEGSACQADKSSFILSSLVSFYKDNKEVDLSLNREYTFHIPKMFENHEEVINTFQAIKNLYYGKPDRYILILNLFIQRSLYKKKNLKSK